MKGKERGRETAWGILVERSQKGGVEAGCDECTNHEVWILFYWHGGAIACLGAEE